MASDVKDGGIFGEVDIAQLGGRRDGGLRLLLGEEPDTLGVLLLKAASAPDFSSSLHPGGLPPACLCCLSVTRRRHRLK